MRCIWIGFALLAVALGTSLAETSSEKNRDPTGRQVDYPFVHILHSRDPGRIGSSAHLRSFEPFLLYQLGRDLTLRRFSSDEGATHRPGHLTVPLYAEAEPREPDLEGVPPRFARDHASSCLLCHSIPPREPGAGQTIASTGPMGRNTPHFFGAGLIEMLGEQIRALVLEEFDHNRNGAIDRSEIGGPRPVKIRPTPDAPDIDFGDLSLDAFGVPQLNSLFRVWYLDADGQRLPHATSMHAPGAVAFDFAVQVFGWGRGWRSLNDGTRVAQGGESSTLRGIYTLAADFHMGLEAHDPSQLTGHGTGGVAGASLSGALQFDLGEVVDRGQHTSKLGFSLDDPDGDGVVSELSQGDLDAIEFYLLHSPQPVAVRTERSKQGRKAFLKIGCQRCHVESWDISARDPSRGLTGDRRLFRLEMSATGDPARYFGSLVRTWRRRADGGLEPLHGAARVEGIYSDFKHWDIGPAFTEIRFDGSRQRQHRTAPLWGVGSSAPYGHAGQLGSLDEAIAAHGGAAEREGRAYRSLPNDARHALLTFLESLVLFPTDWTPVDIDQDGVATPDFSVQGQPMGFEKFDPRFLFSSAPRYEVLYRTTDSYDRRMTLYLIPDVRQLYGLDLEWRKDVDGDRFPDGPATSPKPLEGSP